MTYKHYILKKLLTDFVLINILINGIFYVVTFKDFKGTLMFSDITFDLMIGLILLGIVCSLAGFINIKKDLKKGKVDVSQFKTTSLHHLLPKKLIFRVLILAIGTVATSFILFVLLPEGVGLQQINHMIGFGFKTTTAAIMATAVGVIVIDLTVSDYQLSIPSTIKNINKEKE